MAETTRTSPRSGGPKDGSHGAGAAAGARTSKAPPSPGGPSSPMPSSGHVSAAAGPPPAPRPSIPEAPAGSPASASRRGGIRTDAATFEVVENSLYAVAEEMKVVLAKTACSPILKVAGDYSCGVFDARGNMAAQGPDLPIHLGSMPDAVKAVTAAEPSSASAACARTGRTWAARPPAAGGSSGKTSPTDT